MAEALNESWQKLDTGTYTAITKLVWGEHVTEEVFLRWTQGFQFTEGEPTALIQISGGPCAVIAPVQAYILKNILYTHRAATDGDPTINLKELSAEDARRLLGNSICDVLINISKDRNLKLVTHINKSSEPTAGNSTNSDDGESSHKRPKLFSFNSFHEQLMCKELLFDNFKQSFDWYVEHVMEDFGVLSLLYSVILTYGIDRLNDIVDEPLIDSTHGHGGQCLVNLLLTGEAAANVFDGEQDHGGLKLIGISSQSQIGYLSLLEAHGLVQVGWNLKSPALPIWVLGSATHLTVLFSQDKEAVAEDKQTELMKIINSYDTDGNGFINSAYLGDLMSALNLISEPEEYVDLMKEKLDAEGLGIFLVSSFMEEFFPRDKDADETRKCFRLCHYNGIKRSNNSNKIEYHYCKATLRDFLELTVTTDCSEILKCLQTKWPTIELDWEGSSTPSLD